MNVKIIREERKAKCLVMVAVLVAAFALNGAAFAIEGEVSLSEAPLTIDRAVSIALDQNRTVKSAVLSEAEAAKKVDETRANFGFSVKAKGTYQRVEDSSVLTLPLSYYDVAPVSIGGSTYFAITNPYPNVTTVDAKISPDYQQTGEIDVVKPLFTFGKRKNAVALAGKGVDISLAKTEMSRTQLVSDVKKAFHGVLLAAQAVTLQEQAVARAEAHVAQVRSLYEAGLGTKLDKIRSDTELQSAKEQLTIAEKNYRLACKMLNNLLGNDFSSEIRVSDAGAYKMVEMSPLDAYIALAMDNRPELRQLRLGKEAVRLQTELNKNKPVVAFAGMWYFRSRGSLFVGQDSWRGVLQCEVPLYDSALARAKTAQTRLRENDLGLKETDLTNGIKIQVQNAYLEMDEAGERLKTSESILAAAEEGYRIASVSYKEGVATQLDVIDADHYLTGAGLNHAKAKFDYETAKASLALACGVASVEEK